MVLVVMMVVVVVVVVVAALLLFLLVVLAVVLKVVHYTNRAPTHPLSHPPTVDGTYRYLVGAFRLPRYRYGGGRDRGHV